MIRRRRIDLMADESAGIEDVVHYLQTTALPLQTTEDLDPLLDRVGDARFVLLGEASHGTAEFYIWRHWISRRLIEEKGFSFIAVEGDWPDCYRINRFVKGRPGSEAGPREVLHKFERWPTWMWANEEVAGLIGWMRAHNQATPDENKVGFFGLDVYSLWDSLHSVLEYLQRHDPSAVGAARRAFECFEPYEEVDDYARATAWLPRSCEKEVVELLRDLRSRQAHFAEATPEDQFHAEQNALVVKNAEHYYRTMARGGPDSWNIRDHHMVETLNRLMQHHGPNSKAIVWAHNTHLGDARATDMASDGMVNVGQLVREQYGEDNAVLVGFGTKHGTVIAGRAWDAPYEIMPVPPARDESWEDIMHVATGRDQLYLLNHGNEPEAMFDWRGHRAIGVVYNPSVERFGNYVPTILPRRYDAFLHLETTEAVHPIPARPRVEKEEIETYPTGI